MNVKDISPDTKQFLDDVLQGLGGETKSLPCKYFYDAYGAKLFDRICELDEYYPTRTELAILETNIGDMVERLGPDCLVYEPGSGSGNKTRILLENLKPAAYVPIDIAREHLEATAKNLVAEHPDIRILPICADFTDEFELPDPGDAKSRVLYFPGSTIGNFTREKARDFLARYLEFCDAILVGVDLKKDPGILRRAYNDSEGVTAAFNKNLLRRINHELDGNFRLDAFRHIAVYNEEVGRIELYLESIGDQNAVVAGQSISFRKDERIHTEYSYKYSLDDFRTVAEKAGGRVAKVWTDRNHLFSVQHIVR